MIHEVYPIKMEGSQPYARLVTYIQDYSEAIGIDKRKLVLLCPGGAYEPDCSSWISLVKTWLKNL